MGQRCEAGCEGLQGLRGRALGRGCGWVKGAGPRGCGLGITVGGLTRRWGRWRGRMVDSCKFATGGSSGVHDLQYALRSSMAFNLPSLLCDGGGSCHSFEYCKGENGQF